MPLVGLIEIFPDELLNWWSSGLHLLKKKNKKFLYRLCATFCLLNSQNDLKLYKDQLKKVEFGIIYLFGLVHFFFKCRKVKKVTFEIRVDRVRVKATRVGGPRDTTRNYLAFKSKILVVS